jgi:hypothetical protein
MCIAASILGGLVVGYWLAWAIDEPDWTDL